MSLVSLADPKFAASYFVCRKLLQIQVGGEIPGTVLKAWIQRDTYFGGIKVSILGRSGGFGKQPPLKPADIKIYEEHILLPLKGFQSSSITIETANETHTVPIRYFGEDNTDITSTVAPKQDNPDEPSFGVHVLPPIPVLLLGRSHDHFPTHRITASLPNDNDSQVSARFDEEYIRIWKAGVSNGQLYWDVTWETNPPRRSPQTFQVVTEKWAGPGISGLVESIQPYEIEVQLVQ